MKKIQSFVVSILFFLCILLVPFSNGIAGKKNEIKINSGNEQEITIAEDEDQSELGNADDIENDIDNKAAKKITITGSKYVAKGKKITLKATVSPTGASQKVIWTTSDKKIATVSAKGVVKGLKPGKVKITATSKSNAKVKKTITIEVKAKAVKKVNISGAKELDLAGTKTISLKAKATPSKAAQSFEWMSSDTKVATVNEKGKVTAKKVGTVTITATATDGSKKKATVSITVKDSAVQPEVTPIIAGTLDETAAEAIDLCNTYDGTIPTVAGYEQYHLARLLVYSTDDIPDITDYSPVKIIKGIDHIWIIQFDSPINACKCSDYLNACSDTIHSEPDQPVQNTADFSSSSKAYTYNSWGVSKIHADIYAQYLIAHGKTPEVVVAVIDSGINRSLFPGRKIYNGYDLHDLDKDTSDDNGHGTAVAGVILDCTQGLNISIMPIKVKGSGSSDGNILHLVMGLEAAIQSGIVNVINISQAGNTSWLLNNTVDKAIGKGITVVVSAGNNDTDTANQSPANNTANGCIVVGATNDNDFRWFNSNHGDSLDLCAPGVSINCQNGTWTGTSVAAPHVAAGVAMLLCEYSNLSPAEIESKLKDAATDRGDPGRDSYYGAGLLNLYPFIKCEISSEIFPDPNFRAIISGKDYDTDQDGWFSYEEQKNITSISCMSKDITSLKGIEIFTWLEILNCSSNKLESLDISSNIALKTLYCNYNKLQGLDVSNNKQLIYLYCYGNEIPELNISNNPLLELLYCSDNKLTGLDLSKNNKLRFIQCYGNQFTKLDISGCSPLLLQLVSSIDRVNATFYDSWSNNDSQLLVDRTVTVVANGVSYPPRQPHLACITSK